MDTGFHPYRFSDSIRRPIFGLGLSPNIGNISYYDSSGQSEYSFGKPYSEETAKKIDIEIKGIIENQYDRAIQILTENKDKLDALANKLLEKEVIFREDLEEIFALADRIAVLCGGKLVAVKPVAEWTPATVGLAMTGTRA